MQVGDSSALRKSVQGPRRSGGLGVALQPVEARRPECRRLVLRDSASCRSCG